MMALARVVAREDGEKQLDFGCLEGQEDGNPRMAAEHLEELSSGFRRWGELWEDEVWEKY